MVDITNWNHVILIEELTPIIKSALEKCKCSTFNNTVGYLASMVADELMAIKDLSINMVKIEEKRGTHHG